MSCARHKEFLLHELTEQRGTDFVTANRSLLLTALGYLERQGKLLGDEEFERADEEGRVPTMADLN